MLILIVVSNALSGSILIRGRDKQWPAARSDFVVIQQEERIFVTKQQSIQSRARVYAKVALRS